VSVGPLEKESPTIKLDEMIGEVFAHGPYDVVHFNMGLHGWQKGRIPEGQFEPLTRKLVEALRMGAPKAKLIWASSTPLPAASQYGSDTAIVERNAVAARVMRRPGECPSGKAWASGG